MINRVRGLNLSLAEAGHAFDCMVNHVPDEIVRIQHNIDHLRIRPIPSVPSDPLPSSSRRSDATCMIFLPNVGGALI